MSRFGLSPEAWEFAQTVNRLEEHQQRVLLDVMKRLKLEEDRGQRAFTDQFWRMPVRHGWLDDMEALLLEIPETDA